MKLLLAEDTQDLNRAVSMILTHEGFDVTSAYDGVEAMEYLQKDSFDGIILDIMMPRMDGIEVLQNLRASGIVTPVLLLTAKAEVDDRVTGLDAGADDYLTKPFAMKELVARVKAMTRRSTVYSASELTYEDLKLNADSLELSCENTIRLSIKEFELLQTLILNKNTPLTTEYLLSRVWANEPTAQEDTVWLYISYLKNKLKAIASQTTISGAKGGTFALADRSLT